MQKILIIIPAYNEQKNICNTVKNLKKSKIRVDYIVINDGSTDNTERILKENGINHITLPVNMGIGCAVQTGYKYAAKNNYDIAIQFDGDGQHNAEYISSLVEYINNGYNMVIGSRYINKEGFQSSLLRRIGIKWIRIITRLLIGQASTDSTSGFRACDKELINLFAEEYPMDYPESETYIVAKLNGFKIIDIPVIMNERKEGKSSIKSLKIIYFMIKVTVALFFAKLIWRRREQ